MADGGNFSCEFMFERYETFRDEKLSIDFEMYLIARCMSRNDRTACFHRPCYAFSFYDVARKFIVTTQFAFVPSTAEERRRAHYIQQAHYRNLQRVSGWPRELPGELWLMVAGHLVKVDAVVTTHERVQGCDDEGKSTLDLTQPVYASYFKVDGRYELRVCRMRLDPVPISEPTYCCQLQLRGRKGRRRRSKENICLWHKIISAFDKLSSFRLSAVMNGVVTTQACRVCDGNTCL